MPCGQSDVFLNWESDQSLYLVSKQLGLQALTPVPSSLDPSHPHSHLALHRKPSHSYELGETHTHFLHAAVSQLFQVTSLIMVKITQATTDWALTVHVPSTCGYDLI